MKKSIKRNDDLHLLATQYRKEAEAECENFNRESEAEAAKAFNKTKEARYFREHARHPAFLVDIRLRSALEGEPRPPLRPFDAETLARLLSMRVEPEFPAKEYDETLSDEETVAAWNDGVLVRDGLMLPAKTEAGEWQYTLRSTMLRYARAAASYAKHIGSASLIEWAELIDILDDDGCLYGSLTAERALRVIELEKSAASRLRLDKIIAELPPFKMSKKAKK